MGLPASRQNITPPLRVMGRSGAKWVGSTAVVMPLARSHLTASSRQAFTIDEPWGAATSGEPTARCSMTPVSARVAIQRMACSSATARNSTISAIVADTGSGLVTVTADWVIGGSPTTNATSGDTPSSDAATEQSLMRLRHGK